MCELVGENVCALPAAMSGTKRQAESVEAASSAVKKRAVTAKIVKKLKTDHDRELDTLNVANIQDGRLQPCGQHELFCVYPLQSKDSRDMKFQPSVHRRYAKPTSV